jgi:hypothetical protein
MQAILYLGIALILIGGVWLIMEAFDVSLLWGFGCLLVPPVSLIFVILHWQEAKKPFSLQLAGFGILFLSAMVFNGTV